MAKRNITLSLDQQLLKRARGIAAQRGLSVSAFLAQELERATTRDEAYQRAKAKALALLESPFRLGGRGIASRDTLHDRRSLR